MVLSQFHEFTIIITTYNVSLTHPLPNQNPTLGVLAAEGVTS
jgi:hypothetical protein